MITEQTYISKAQARPAQKTKGSVEDATAVLANVRMIIRASDIYSKKLHKLTGLTTAQALSLRAIDHLGEVTTKNLSDFVSISQATLTSVLDRLESKNLIDRYRSKKDRRVVHTRLTKEGAESLGTMPELLDETFIDRFAHLPAKRRKEISSALSEVAVMMNADATDAAPAVNGRDKRRVKQA